MNNLTVVSNNTLPVTSISMANTDEISMTSLEIASLTGKEHRHVMRDIRVLFKELEKSGHADQPVCGFSARINNLGFSVKDPHYILDKKHAHCLVMGYSAAMRMAVLNRIEELEVALQQMSKPEPYKLPNRLELAQMVIDAENETSRLEEINSDKTFGQLTMSTVVGGCRKDAHDANMYLVHNGYMRSVLGKGGKALGYVPTEKGKDFIIPRSSDASRYKSVMFTKGVFNILPEHFIRQIRTIH